jgi:hypothetical protein
MPCYDVLRLRPEFEQQAANINKAEMEAYARAYEESEE